MTDTRDRAIINKLLKSGVTSVVIAKAFGLPTQEVAAYKAHNTMRQSAAANKAWAIRKASA